jgi:hypothetical protein
MKSISTQYQELKEGKMTQHQFLRNARMMFPNHVTQFNSFEDSVKILKNKGLLNEGNAVKGTPDKAPTYDYPTQPGKYMKVVQEPEVDEQDGIYPATTVTDIPKEEVSKRVSDTSDGLEPIKPHDKKNEMKKIRIVKESKKNLTEADIKSAAKKGMSTGDYSELDALVFGKASNIKEVAETSDVKVVIDMIQNNSTLMSKIKDINNAAEFKDFFNNFLTFVDPKLIQNPTGLKSAVQSAISTMTGQEKDFSTPMLDKSRTMVPFSNESKLKDKIKKIIREFINEYEEGDESDEAPSIPGVIDIIIKDIVNRIESNDLDLEFKEKEIIDVFNDFQDKIGHRYSEDQFNAIIDGAVDELKKKGYNIK